MEVLVSSYIIEGHFSVKPADDERGNDLFFSTLVELIFTQEDSLVVKFAKVFSLENFPLYCTFN